MIRLTNEIVEEKTKNEKILIDEIKETNTPNPALKFKLETTN